MKSICVVFVLALVLSACGGSSDPAEIVVAQSGVVSRPYGESEVVVCFDSSDTGHGFDAAGFAEALAERTDAWIEVPATSIVAAQGEDLHVNEFVAPLTDDIDGFATNKVFIDSSLASLAEEGFDSLLFPVRQGALPEGGREYSSAIGVFVPSTDQTWQAVLACYDRTFEALTAWSNDAAIGRVDGLAEFNMFLTRLVGFDGKNSTPAVDKELVARLVDDVGFEFDETEPLSWEQREPLERSLHDAPDEVLLDYENELLLVTLPEAWSGQSGATICSRTASGWNSCFATDFRVEGSDLIPLEALRGKGESIEITISPASEPSRQNPRVLVTIAGTSLETAAQSSVVIKTDLSPTAAATAPDAVRVQVETGTDLLSD